jgi:hypothetical protein
MERDSDRHGGDAGDIGMRLGRLHHRLEQWIPDIRPTDGQQWNETLGHGWHYCLRWAIQQTESKTSCGWCGWRVYSDGSVGVEANDDLRLPIVDCRLKQNYPNPFKQLTAISYQLSAPGNVSLKVYNVAGQRVRTLVSGAQGAGPHLVIWNGLDEAGAQVSAGVYLYRLSASGCEETRRLVVLR